MTNHPGSFGEARVNHLIRAHGIADGMVRQHRIGSYKVDFAWPAHRIVIEADGRVHKMVRHLIKGRVRDIALRAKGWYVHHINIERSQRAVSSEVESVAALIFRLHSSLSAVPGTENAKASATAVGRDVT